MFVVGMERDVYGNGAKNSYKYHRVTRNLKQSKVHATATDYSKGEVMRRGYKYNNLGMIDQSTLTPHRSIINMDFEIETDYTYDGMLRLTNSKSTAIATPFSEYSLPRDHPMENHMPYSGDLYEVSTSYISGSRISTKTSIPASSGPVPFYNQDIDYELAMNYHSTKLNQLDEVIEQTPNGTVSTTFKYNTSGSMVEIDRGGGGAGTMNMLWNMEQQLVADTKDGDVHHYVYDYTGERLLKGKVSYYSMWQDDEWLSSSFVLDAYTVYVNPYAVVQNMDYDGNSIQWITNHYYSGMQRLASGMAVRQYTARPGAGGDEPSPVLDELEQHMAHFGYEEGKDYTRSSFEQPYQLTMQFPQVSNKQEGSPEEGGSTQSNPLGACTGIYSDLYWYHPNYLEDGASRGLVDLVCEHPGRRPVDLVTDLYGTVHQGFLYTPWGENMHEHHATTSGFNSPFRFNAKELDETGLAYYGARYYQNRYSMWLSVDPLAKRFPQMTPYNFTGNNPIHLIDPNGMSPVNPGKDEIVLPSNPNELDRKTWIEKRPAGLPDGQGHSKYYQHVEKDIWLVFDEKNSNKLKKNDPHYHMYHGDGKGGILKVRFDGNGEVLPRKYFDSKAAHLEPGSVLNLSRAISNLSTKVFLAFDLLALFTDSPQNPLYMMYEPGDGEQNRAYIHYQTGYIYEWKNINSKTRQVNIYKDYDYINGEWRGVSLIRTDFFDKNGKKALYHNSN